jgi:hypothetical protein
MRVVFQVDEVALRMAARYKLRYLRTRRKLQRAEVRIGELEALVSGLRNQNEWLRELRDHPDQDWF